MKLICALGNPEPEFTYTRHNVGKDVLNQFVDLYFTDYDWEFKKKFKSDMVFVSEPADVILVKPTCFMNEGGIPLQKISSFYKVSSENILIIYDELDLVVGEYKLSQGKGSRIHNGVKSVNSSIKNSENIWHLRVGVRDEKIGQSVQKSGRDPTKYVLAKLPISDRKKIKKLVEESISKDINSWLSKKD